MTIKFETAAFSITIEDERASVGEVLEALKPYRLVGVSHDPAPVHSFTAGVGSGIVGGLGGSSNSSSAVYA